MVECRLNHPGGRPMRLIPTASLLALALTAATGAAQIPSGPPTAAPAPGASTPAASARDPAAIAALERMGTYLRTLTTFAISGDLSTEEVLETGQTLQYNGSIELIAQRPGHLRANLDSSRKRRQYFYDGQNLTIWAPRQGYYATVPAPPTIGAMIETASERLGLVVPLADMFELGSDPVLTNRITSGFLVGTEAVDDQKCLHYAFRQPDVDWEIWIREGDQPLPCMYRITDLRDPSRPDYEVLLTWDLQPVITPETFVFVAPEGADRIPVATATASAEGARP
jgi:hypothetical protein